MKREDLPVVTPDEFRRLGPCWFETEEGRARYERIAAQRAKWSALDVLDLGDVSARDKLWSVLREEFLPEMLLHEFACRCAEHAFSFVNAPDPRSVEAIRVKRRWMAGEATDSELCSAWNAAVHASSKMAARFAEMAAPWYSAQASAWSAQSAASWYSARDSAWSAARYAARAEKGSKALFFAMEHEVEILRNLINEWGE